MSSFLNPVVTEAEHPFACLVSWHRESIDEIIIAQNQTIVVGQVLGPIGVAAEESVTSTFGAGNTGNGTIGTVTINSAAIDGAYSVVFITAGATAEFEITDPNGILAGTGKVGTAYSGALGFTITTGGTNFAVGDTLTIQVLRPQGEAGEQWEAWNPAATDGSQAAHAVALYPAVTSSGQTQKIAAARRNCEVRAADLTWNGSATANQIAEGVNQLAKDRIITR